MCEQTLDFVLREMTHALGGFYSSLDADSQGEEGKFYTWTPQEIRAALGKAQDAELVIAAYQVTEGAISRARTSCSAPAAMNSWLNSSVCLRRPCLTGCVGCMPVCWRPAPSACAPARTIKSW